MDGFFVLLSSFFLLGKSDSHSLILLPPAGSSIPPLLSYKTLFGLYLSPVAPHPSPFVRPVSLPVLLTPIFGLTHVLHWNMEVLLISLIISSDAPEHFINGGGWGLLL